MLKKEICSFDNLKRFVGLNYKKKCLELTTWLRQDFAYLGLDPGIVCIVSPK